MGEFISYKVTYCNGGGDFSTDDIRRFQVSQGEIENFGHLVEKLQLAYPHLKRPVTELRITYTDRDGDCVRITNDEGLAIALTEMEGPVFRLQLTEVKQSLKQQQTQQMYLPQQQTQQQHQPQQQVQHQHLSQQQVQHQHLPQQQAQHQHLSQQQVQQQPLPQQQAQHQHLPQQQTQQQPEQRKQEKQKLSPTFVHEGIKCDGCHTDPLVGDRFRCTTCPDFDLCSMCRQNNAHPEHRFELMPQTALSTLELIRNINRVRSGSAVPTTTEEYRKAAVTPFLASVLGYAGNIPDREVVSTPHTPTAPLEGIGQTSTDFQGISVQTRYGEVVESQERPSGMQQPTGGRQTSPPATHHHLDEDYLNNVRNFLSSITRK